MTENIEVEVNPYKSPQSPKVGGSADLPYRVTCACGGETPVSASAAGGSATCRHCGKEIAVPSLSRLRQLTGKGAYEAGTADVIRRMISSGELPEGEFCQISGRPTEHVETVYVHCEKTWKRPVDSIHAYIPFLLMGIFSLPFYLIRACSTKFHTELEVLGRDVIVPAPVRLHEDCRRELKRASQRKLRRILRNVPIYAKLLEEYPHAKIIVKEP